MIPLLLALVPTLSSLPAQEAPLDVVLVVADDLAPQDVAAAHTPAIDALAAGGVSFANAFAMPNCSPGRHTILFGQWPRRAGIGTVVNSWAPAGPANPVPRDELVSLAELFRRGGYRTGLIGKWHLGPAVGADVDPETAPLVAAQSHGFDDWRAGSPANLRSMGAGYEDWLRVDDGEVRQETAYATTVMRDAALAWWRETEGPKLLVVSLQAPHAPFHTPPEGTRAEGADAVVATRTDKFLAMVSTVDRVVGDLRAVVDPERTLFVFTADNGTPEILNGARKGRGKGTCHDRGVTVPLIVVGPGVTRGAVSQELVGTVDLYATLAEGAGLERDAAHEGEDSLSFAGALSSPAAWKSPRGWIFAEVYGPKRDDVMVRDARYKLRILDGQQTFLDLENDPAELRPRVLPEETLGAPEVEALERLRAILDGLPPRA